MYKERDLAKEIQNKIPLPDFYFTRTLSNTIFFFSIGEKSPGKGCASYLTLLSSLIESSLA